MATNGGLFQYHSATGTYTHFTNNDQPNQSLNHNHLLCLFEDSKNQIWVGSHNGLNVLIPDSLSEKGYLINGFFYEREDRHSLSYSLVYAISEDQKGRIWVGTTGGGLNVLLNEGTDSSRFRHFFKTDGLPSNNIEGIIPDDAGNLWVSTDAGLCVFHQDSLLERENPANYIRRYHLSDGLQGTEFVEGAFDKCPDGQIYLGGMEGFNAFHPTHLKDNPHSPEIYLTGLRNTTMRLGGRIWLPDTNYFPTDLRGRYQMLKFSGSGERQWIKEIGYTEFPTTSGIIEHSIALTTKPDGTTFISASFAGYTNWMVIGNDTFPIKDPLLVGFTHFISAYNKDGEYLDVGFVVDEYLTAGPSSDLWETRSMKLGPQNHLHMTGRIEGAYKLGTDTLSADAQNQMILVKVNTDSLLDLTTALDPQMARWGLQVYPNPSSGQVS